MITKSTLCERIRAMYPDIGECGLDINVEYDNSQKKWAVDLKKGAHHLKTFLEEGDAEACLIGKKCIGLGIEINQLRDSIDRRPQA